MQQHLEATIIGKKTESVDSNVEQLEEEADAQDLLFSERLSSLCYWVTILLLAIAGGYLIRWQFIHPGSYAEPVNDPWGITTPPWLVLPVAPIGVILSLGHAAWCALRGQRTWKMLMTAGSLIVVLACGKLLEA
jgi:hypothetical protein